MLNQSSFLVRNPQNYIKFKAIMSSQGKGMNDAINDYIDKVAKQQITTLHNWNEKLKMPDFFDDVKSWKAYKSKMDVQEWKSFDDRLNILIRLSEERRKELSGVGLL